MSQTKVRKLAVEEAIRGAGFRPWDSDAFPPCPSPSDTQALIYRLSIERFCLYGFVPDGRLLHMCVNLPADDTALPSMVRAMTERMAAELIFGGL